MKIKELSAYPRLNSRPVRRSRRNADGPNIRIALLGAACVLGVFGVLALLYHLG